ncbi:hypothetical protein SELMODRAFT_83728 [Selaginella moellendorffii]|uniref:SCP domain-containing protein n=1 Tax=Selaginella moellendorffii TaxID=88036 RepID=D8R227_SELML|nr:pathogenesis-related protein 1B [Selaginella moellendorffii]EFJ33654.1 hypothetical protein SELMODRAFT_83728 [Selaginella moellendorffii]|eukprot:XP_002964816.1 pathogenesis-related protein 1B [Selaginella moellendorffii]
MIISTKFFLSSFLALLIYGIASTALSIESTQSDDLSILPSTQDDFFSILASTQSDFLGAHNSARASIATSPRIPPVSWSNDAAAFAMRWITTLRDTRNCNMVHSGNRAYGENLYKWMGSPGLPSPNPAEAVKSWVNEKRDYRYASNSCAAGKVCGHYTQVVWRNTKRVGCASIKCPGNMLLVSCNYDPPGNWVGQKPY